MTEEQPYSMQEREKEQCDWKVSKPNTTPPHKVCNTVKTDAKSKNSFAYQWEVLSKTRKTPAPRSRFSRVADKKHMRVWEREPMKFVCVWWKNSRAIIPPPQQQEEDGCVGIVVVAVGGAW